MFKDGKLFGKINIVDIAVILIVIILIVCATIKFRKFNQKTADSASQTIVYQIDVQNVREYTLEMIKSGDTIYDEQTGVNIGEVVDITSKPAETFETLPSGEVVEVYNPYRFDIVLTIETPGTVETNAYYANKSIELKVNSTKVIETKYLKTTGTISNISIK